MLKHKRENRLVGCLVCWKCHSRTGPNHFKLEHGGATCSLCGNLNPLANLRNVPLGEVNAVYEVVVCFGPDTHHDGGIRFNTLSVPEGNVIGRSRTTPTEEIFVRLLLHVGATDEQMAEYRLQRKSWGQGSVHVRFLPNRKNLLRVDYTKM